MIQQIQLVLSPPNDVRISQSWSYRLYGWLMSQISSEFGEQMHLQGEHPIAHLLCFSLEKQSLIWTVNLLNDAARQVVFPVLESAKEIPLQEQSSHKTVFAKVPAMGQIWRDFGHAFSFASSSSRGIYPSPSYLIWMCCTRFPLDLSGAST